MLRILGLCMLLALALFIGSFLLQIVFMLLGAIVMGVVAGVSWIADKCRGGLNVK